MTTMNRFLILPSLLALALAAGAQSQNESIRTLTAEALHQRLEAKSNLPLVVDVREPSEFEAGHIDGARLAPLAGVEKDLDSVAKDREIVLVCHSGRRSGIAYQRLAARGYTNLFNMEGGMLAWEKLGYPVTK